MITILKKEFILEGLDCANCATKIETQINNLTEIKSANVNFALKKLYIEVNSDSEIEKIIMKIYNIVKGIEPDIKVISIDKNNTKKEDSVRDGKEQNRNEIIKICLGTIIFTFGLILNLPSYLEFILFLTSYIIVGSDIVIKAFKNIIKGKIFDENFLMTIATVGAFAIGEFPEGVAVMLFYQIGELFQDLAVNNSRKSISALMDIKPDFANLKFENSIKKVSPEEVKIGDVIIVKPGEKIPLDGKVIDGESMLDTSSLTGEALPRKIYVGDEALSGCINKNGVLTILVTKEFGESTVTKILDLVQNASSKKALTENFITKFARYYTPIVVILAVIIAVFPPLLINGSTFSEWIYRALVFLVISCPCALVVSIPLGFFSGIGAASKNGILIKGSNYLEALNNIDTVILDKTGTLTQGVFNVTEINPQNNYTKEELLKYAAYAESYSNHPIAISILKAYGKEVDKTNIEKYDEIPGHGCITKYKGKEVIAGNIKLMDKQNIKYDKVQLLGTVVYISVDNIYVGNIVISDEIKSDSKEAIKNLKSIGIEKVVMLTGDIKVVGEKIGKQIGIDEVYTDLLPAEKVEKLELFTSNKTSNGNIVFVGDGMNDAPVLARADVGIAMGGLGSDAAIEAADIVIMTDEPSKIVTAIKIAKRTRKIIWQNIIFALGVKSIFLILGVFGISSMWEAVFADAGVSVIAVINSMRAMKTQKR